MQDYGRLHNYKVIAATNLADPSLDNMWNKVGWLLKAYHVSPSRHPAILMVQLSSPFAV